LAFKTYYAPKAEKVDGAKKNDAGVANNHPALSGFGKAGGTVIFRLSKTPLNGFFRLKFWPIGAYDRRQRISSPFEG